MIQHICVNALAIIGIIFVAIMAAILIYGFWKIAREL